MDKDIEVICQKIPGTQPGGPADAWTDGAIYWASRIGDSLTYSVFDDTGTKRVIVLERPTALLSSNKKIPGHRRIRCGMFLPVKLQTKKETL